MIEWSLDAFGACESVRSIVVAAPPNHVGDLAERPGLTVVSGGATRAQSVANALEAVETELVAHLGSESQAAGAIAAAPVTDTIKQAAPSAPGAETRPPFFIDEMKNGGRVVEATLDRSRLWAAQTPQIFRADALRRALAVDAGARDAATDEAMLVEAAGGTVLIHPASVQNFKVTTPLDLRVAELLLSERVESAEVAD